MDGPFPRTEAKRLVRNFVCGECDGELIDPWGGAYGPSSRASGILGLGGAYGEP